MSRLSSQTEGKAGELLFAILAMIGSRGLIKAGLPMVDDEGRDVEIHLAGRFLAALAVQVKIAAVWGWDRKRRSLKITVPLGPQNMIDHPCYWYFLAHLDRRQIRLSEYVFLVPSAVVHRHCVTYRGRPLFRFEASVEPEAHDQWTPYRLKATDLGKRLVELMRQDPRGFAETDTLVALRKIPGICMFGMQPAPAGVKTMCLPTLSITPQRVNQRSTTISMAEAAA